MRFSRAFKNGVDSVLAYLAWRYKYVARAAAIVGTDSQLFRLGPHGTSVLKLPSFVPPIVRGGPAGLLFACLLIIHRVAPIRGLVTDRMV